MAAIQGSNQSPTITQKYLNTASYAGDPTPGALVSTAQVSGSIVQPYSGMVGGILTLGEGGANNYSDPVNGQQLYAGDYQYVQFLSSSTATAKQGCILFWQNVLGGNWIVTPDATLTDDSLIAGIALTNTGKGNWWWIQVKGIAEVLFKATITKTTPAIGDLVVVDAGGGTPTDTADVLADATAITNASLKLALGRAWGTAPVSGAGGVISPVALGLGPIYVPGA